ncbi:DoxX family membrane protein [Brachybacterium sp. GU-2]|uniref:DoxX family protein n=1 Tax=Brachybacterium sp. GU-2 TaxID=3069708 RepID=UPI00280ACDB3|nr:DoxX family membrane protein [Brachybacterium sp. GU-2]WME23759.1 DoxX family membrane protein [Brachybacterium sp. GU-2]
MNTHMSDAHPVHCGRARTAVRLLLGSALTYAGVTHLTSAREEFRAQVPSWVPVSEDATVLASGVTEIALGAALLSGRRQRVVGGVVAAFFVAVFPGNVAQWRNKRDGFGLDTDRKRLLRLPFQIPLIVGALWSTRGRRPVRHPSPEQSV